MAAARTFSFLLFAPLAALLAVGCPELSLPPPCANEIPPGGCPFGRGASCQDPTCTGIYECVNAVWVSVKVCPPPDGGGGGGGGGGGFPGDGGACTPVVVNAKNTGVNCTPDLEAPDCPIEASGQCEETACLSGCIDFFVCGSNHVWLAAAYCDDNGQFVSM